MKRIFLFLIFCGFNLIYFQAISIHAQTNDAKYYVSVAVTYFKMHENETAQHYIDSALFINPSYAYAYIMLSKLTERNNGNHSETIQILHYAIKSAKKNIEKIQLYQELADIQLEDKKYEECRQTIGKIFQMDAQAIEGYFEKALLDYQLQNYKQTLSTLKSALKLTSDKKRLAELNFLTGLTYKKLQDNSKAKKHFQASLETSLQDAAEVEIAQL